MRLFALAFLSLLLISGEAPASDLYLKYKLYALGLPIGSGTLSVSLNEETYSLKSSGQTAAFGRLVSDGKGTVEVRGGLNGGTLVPESYSLKVNSEDDTGTVSMQMKAGKVAKVAVNPPQDRMKERIKVTAEHLQKVLDPLSAALLPAPKGLEPDSCNRSLQLYDGKERYNVHLSYKTKRKAKTADGRFKGDVLVCKARYEPIAGHRPKRKTIQELARNKSIEVWLAPVGEASYLVPLRASIKAPFGALVVQAEKYKLSN
ncbi:DUF3108 domain-containing protein [Roseibium sp. SCP14]|uniref:DUF3108 domain-containing protein n=1 Tax=Roseibium sp. SCP14 TaxID=3141375 RepID=UPI00333B59D2